MDHITEYWNFLNGYRPSALEEPAVGSHEQSVSEMLFFNGIKTLTPLAAVVSSSVYFKKSIVGNILACYLLKLRIQFPFRIVMLKSLIELLVISYLKRLNKTRYGVPAGYPIWRGILTDEEYFQDF